MEKILKESIKFGYKLGLKDFLITIKEKEIEDVRITGELVDSIVRQLLVENENNYE